MAIHKDRAYFLKSAEVGSNIADQYYEIVTQTKRDLEAQNIRVCAIVGDNASGVQGALKRCLPPLALTVFSINPFKLAFHPSGGGGGQESQHDGE